MSDSQEGVKPGNLTPDVLEAASILVAMKRGMRYFLLEAQQARYQLSYLDFTSLNPGSPQLHYLSGHRIPFSPLYDITPMPAAYHFPLAHAQPCSIPQPVAYYGMLASPPCYVGPPREHSSTCAASTEGVVDSESIQPAVAAPKKMRLSNASTSSPECAVTEKQESKRKRKNYTKEQLEILEAAYARKKYPHIEERLKLEEITKLTEDRIQVWFQNRRAKDRKKMESEQWQKNPHQKLADGVDAKKSSENRPTKGARSPERKNSNSSSDISDNGSGEFDNFTFSESQTE